MELLEHLTQEHRMAQGLLDQLATSEEGSERMRMLSELESALSTHMAVEEQFLYPIVGEVMGADEEEGAETEHDLVRDGLGKMRDLLDAPGFAAAVDMVRAGINHHIEEEEQGIFPALRRGAPEQLEQLGTPEELQSRVMSAAKSRRKMKRTPSRRGEVSGEATRDELYERAKRAGIEGRSHMNKEELRAALSKK